MFEIDKIESCLTKYLSNHNQGIKIQDFGISFILSGSNSFIMNYAIIHDSSNISNKKESIEKNFNVNGLILSYPEDIEHVKNMGNFRYLGRILVAISNGFSGDQLNKEIDVRRVGQNNIEDYCNFMMKERSIEKDIMLEIIDSNREDLYLYVSYDGDSVIGSGSAIRNGSIIFIFDTIVREDVRNNGVFSAIVSKSMKDVSQEGEYEYYALISSPQSLSGAVKANYKEHTFMDVWINNIDEVE